MRRPDLLRPSATELPRLQPPSALPDSPDTDPAALGAGRIYQIPVLIAVPLPAARWRLLAFAEARQCDVKSVTRPPPLPSAPSLTTG